jgi:imidazole glycerol-phosphate synthase subunit HisF
VGRYMLTKRIIPCLDIRDKKVTKGVRFKNNVVLGDPVDMAAKYYADGCDELVFYDITASAEHRPIDIEMVRAVARAIHIPFAVGGGISGLDDMSRVLLAGAEKISVNSLAVSNPRIIADGAREFGSQCIVLGMDPVKVDDRQRCPSGYEITVRGFRERAGLDALAWAKQAEDLGVGEIVVNSVDADGTREGYEIQLTRMIAEHVGIPVVASGGAGKPSHLADVFREGKADAAIIAGMIHTGAYTISQIKAELVADGLPVRRSW